MWTTPKPDLKRLAAALVLPGVKGLDELVVPREECALEAQTGFGASPDEKRPAVVRLVKAIAGSLY
jgi:hypothetical protein